MGRILTIEQAAEMLQLNPQVVRQYLREGKLPGRKIGRHWRVVEEDVMAFIREGGHSTLEMWNERARQWHSLSPEEKKRRLYSIAGKYAHIPFSSEDIMNEHHEEVDRDERRLARGSGE